MKLSYVTFVIAAAVSSSGLVACSGEPSPGIPPSRTAGAISYTSPSALPSCDAASDLRVAYIVETGRFVVCFEGAWRELAPGPAGKDGKDGARGAQGDRGVQGFDGAQGEQGPQGLPGVPGLDGKDGQDGQDGTNGTNGADGTNGANGANGHSALVEMHDEPAGPNCKAGGVAITVGIDVNDNGALDEGEGKTSYVCHGVSAEPPPPACGGLFQACCADSPIGCNSADLFCDATNHCAPIPPPPVCSPLGMFCISGAECCTGNCVFSGSAYPTTFPMPTMGTCADVATVCQELGTTCERDTECCSGSCYWSPYNTMHGNCVSPL